MSRYLNINNIFYLDGFENVLKAQAIAWSSQYILH